MNSPRIKTICKLLEACRYRHDLYNVFSDCIEMMAIAMSNAADFRQRDAREARYMQIVGKYERDVIETFPKVLAEVTMAMEEDPGDVLGRVFGELELHNTARGQFFTPDEICRLMARLSIGTPDELQAMIAEKGYIAAMEPACGAGAMLIAMALALQERGICYQRQLHITAVDIDPRAVHMAYVQLSLLHIPAVIVLGNTLTMEEREHWYTPAHILGGWSARRRLDRASATPSIKTDESAPEAAPQAAKADDRPEPVIIPAIGQGGQLTLL